MSILTKTVSVPVSSRYCKYYQELGYAIPMKVGARGHIVIDQSKYIDVSVDDLPQAYKCLIEVQCDNPQCGKIQTIDHERYMRNFKNHDGKYFCHSCSMTLFNSGENNYLWKDKSEDERILTRNYQEYRDFINKVLARDNYTCQCCGRTHNQCKLNVHHLNGYHWFEEGRIDESNAITLCKDCHSNFHSEYGRWYNTKEQFMEWMNISKLELDKCPNLILPRARELYCYEEGKKYRSVGEFAKTHDIKSSIHIYHVCDHIIERTVKKFHVFWYDEYINMSEQEIIGYVNNTAKIITLSQLNKIKKEGVNESD